MDQLKVIAKGNYSYSQQNQLVSLKQFIFVEKEGRKYLLLRVKNHRSEKLSSIKFVITQINGKGEEIISNLVEFSDLNGGANDTFVINNLIKVENECVDFKFKLIEAKYGNFVYGENSNSSFVTYERAIITKNLSAEELFKKVGSKDRLITTRKIKAPFAVGVLAIVVIICSVLATYLHLNSFSNWQTGFSLSNIQYRFYNNDVDSGKVYISGYYGDSDYIYIPSRIEGYDVIGIDTYAFAGNDYLKNVDIEGDITISTGAFWNCRNLKYIDLSQVATIESYAFSGCNSLSSITSYNLRSIGSYAFSDCYNLSNVELSNYDYSIEIGKNAFSTCYNLNNVIIDQNIDYTKNSDFFYQSSINNLYLKNINSFGALQSRFNELTLNNLFGGGEIYLNNLTIGSADYIPKNFCRNSTLYSIEFKNLGNAIVNDYAFSNCYNLNQIILPLAIKEVGDYAFENTAISTFNASNVSNIGVGAFQNCSMLTSFNVSNNTEILKIPDRAFKGCFSLQSFSIPENVQTVGEYAFEDCTNLSNVVLTTKITSIGDYAFNNCTSITKVVIPQNVTYIGYGSFKNCSSLEELTIPFIGDTAYSNKYLSYMFGSKYFSSSRVPSSLAKVTVTNVDVIGSNAFYNCNNIQEIVLPDSVTQIGAYAFYECPAKINLEDLDELQIVGEYAFRGNTRLTEITLPESVTNIGYGVFENCSNLKELTIPFIGQTQDFNTCFSYLFGSNDYNDNSNKVPSSLAKVTVTNEDEIGDYTFYGCENIQEIVYPDNVTRIGYQAFRNCYNLRQFKMPDQVMVIDSSAFRNCGKLRSITLPKDLVIIGDRAFENCYKLFEVYNFSGLNISRNSFSNGQVGFYALKIHTPGDMTSLPKVFKDGLEFIKADDVWYLVDYNGTLTSINLPKSFEFNSEVVNEYVINANSFRENYEITEVTITSSVTEIGENAFYCCENLSNIQFDSKSKLSYIGQYAFYSCSTLKEAVLPNSLTYICTYAFSYCINLNSVTLPESLENIEYNAFENCKRLLAVYNFSDLDIELGSTAYGSVARHAIVIHTSPVVNGLNTVVTGGLKYMGYGDKWVLVEYTGSQSNVTLGSFRYNGATISSYSIHYEAFNNNETITQITIGEEVTSIDDYAFYNCYNLQNVIIEGNELTKIGTYAFSNCISLQSINLPLSLQTIGYGAFQNCSNLLSIAIPYGVERIEGSTFAYCYSLQTVTMPQSLMFIGQGAFYLCNSLLSIVIPQNVTSIGSDAFYNCTSLISVNNQSSLNITLGSTSYGWVAYYAVEVVNGINYDFVLHKVGNETYVKFNKGWHLYNVNDLDIVNQTYTLPESFIYNGQRINQYYLMNNALSSISFSNLVVPTSVKGLDINNLTSSGWYWSINIYYCSNEADWKEITNDATNSRFNVYFYSDCIHENGYWKYDNNGNITISYSELEWEVITESTCSKPGSMLGNCPDCNYSEVDSMPLADHEFGNGDNCINCGAPKPIQVTEENFNSLSYLQNNSTYAFKIEDGLISSTNKTDSTSATLSIIATVSMKVDFVCYTSSEENFDVLQIALNGNVVQTISGKSLQYQFSYELDKGEQLSFTYSKDMSSSEGDDCAYITNLYITL